MYHNYLDINQSHVITYITQLPNIYDRSYNIDKATPSYNL